MFDSPLQSLFHSPFTKKRIVNGSRGSLGRRAQVLASPGPTFRADHTVIGVGLSGASANDRHRPRRVPLGERPESAHSCLCASHREAATVAPKPAITRPQPKPLSTLKCSARSSP